MSMFGSIMSSIFGSSQISPAVASTAQALASSPEAGPATKPAAPSAQQMKVDVAAVLDKLADEAELDLDWRNSIVDMMKLLKLDSSLGARKQLAKELKFAGDTKDTATMNVWLHKQVMVKLAENGGEVPADLKN